MLHVLHCGTRLSPSDIHRLHASVPGRVVKIARHKDKFMASEYAAVYSHMDIMTENNRQVMEFESGYSCAGRDGGGMLQVYVLSL